MNRYQLLDDPVDRVAQLATFLRENGSQISDRTCKFSISTTTLVYVNRCIYQHTHRSVQTTVSAEREEDVAYLMDFFQRTHAAKLVHGTDTLQGAVDICHFRALTFLEIKRVPVHLLAGLKALRRQLEILICSRSITSIHTLLASCGGDMSSEAPWSSLHTINLSHNHIDTLDESLKLLPSLKVLDLSHNDIKHTRHYLEDLSELTHLNLSFNRLETIPALGLVARTNLKSLSLKHNNLERLDRLNDYTNLEVLDVATNCIYNMMEVRMLGYLHSLKAVYLHGNPLNYDPIYRLLIVKSLPSQAPRNKTKIDGVPLTPSEAEMISRENITLSPPMSRRRPSLESQENALNADISSFEDSMDLGSSTKLLHKEKRKGKRGLKKVKHAAIADPTKAHLDHNTSINTSDSDIEGTKHKIEDMRKYHGSDWLLALQAPYSQPTLDPEPSEDRDGSQDGKPLKAINGRQEVQTTEVETIICNDGTVKAIIEPPIEREMTIVESSKAPETSLETSPLVEKIVDSIAPAGNIYAVKSSSSGDSKTAASIYAVKSTESDIVGQGDKEEDEALELLNPLIVSVFMKDDSEPTQLFVTVKSTHIEEKDLLGQITEELELASLKGMQKSVDTLRDPDSQELLIVPVVELTFDYVRRDRQKRKYYMENEDSCEAMVEILEPFVARSQALAREKGMVQCLKCSAEFHKQAAKRKVHKRQRKSTVQNTMAGSQDEYSSSDIESMNEVLVCPECNSGMLVDLEHPCQAFPSSLSTPMGSLSSLDTNTKPIATSSPWKPLDKDSIHSSSSTDYHSANEGSLSTSHQSTSSQHIVNSSTPSTLTGDTPTIAYSFDNQTPSSVNVSAKSQLSNKIKKSLVGDFNLPESTMRMSIGDSADGEISPYPPEKLSQMLYTGVRGFDQKYSLVPADLLSGTSSNEASRSSTPRSRGSSESKSRTMSTDSYEDGHSEQMARSKEAMISGKPPQFPASDQSVEGSRLSTRYRTPSVTNSEDDIEVLDRHDVSNPTGQVLDRHDVSNPTGQVSVSNQDSQKPFPFLQSEVHNSSRLDSNDSDIAVILDQTDELSSKPDVNSDTVFDTQTNLASALSDVASRIGDLSPVPELNSNALGQEISSNGTNDYVHSDLPNTDMSSRSDRTAPDGEQPKDTDSPLEHSFTESQMNDGTLAHSSKSVPVQSVEVDFTKVDHRLKLHFDMTLFGDDEEFKCMIKASIFQLSKSVDFKGYLLVSSHNLFILKITKEESDTPSDWLSKRTQHSIRDLLHVHVGLGSQSFQLQFNNDGVLYTVAVRDSKACQRFVTQITDVVHNSPVTKKKFKGIVKDHPNTLANLLCQVFGARLEEIGSDVDTTLTLYLLGYRKVMKEMKKSLSLQLEPIGIAVTASQLYLIGENHYCPLRQTNSRGSARGQSSKQFIHHSQHAITDISGLELYEDAPCDLTISFSVEETGEETQWHIQTEGTSSMTALIDAIQSPWQQLFGVAMPQTIHPSISLQDDFE